jgi:hypothetical protein
LEVCGLHARRILVGMDAGKVYPLSAHDERRAAVAAGCDPRTIRAWSDPSRRTRMRSTTRGRIGEVLRELGLDTARTASP